MAVISTLAEIMVAVVDAVLILMFLNSCFSKKERAKPLYYGVACIIFASISFHFCSRPEIELALFIVATSLFSVFFLNGKILTKVMTCFAAGVFIQLLNMVTALFICWLYDIEMYKLFLPHNPVYVLVLFIDKITLFVICMNIIHINTKDRHLDRRENIILIFFYFMYFLGTSLTIPVLMSNRLDAALQNDLLCLDTLLLLANFAIYFLIDDLDKKNKSQIENLMLKLQLNEEEAQVKSTEAMYMQAKRIHHDTKNYLITYLQLLKQGEYKLVEDDIEKQLNQRVIFRNVVYVNCKVVNAVINEKYTICEAEGINFKIQTSGELDCEKGMNYAMMLANLLDNAIEAEKKEIEKKEIKLNIFTNKNMVNFIVENYISSSVLKSNPFFRTTKKDNENHGIGLNNVRLIVERLGGTISISEDSNYFIAHILFTDSVCA